MKLYLAGDVPWRNDIYAKTIINPSVQKNGGKSMKLHLAGGESGAQQLEAHHKMLKPYILESFLQTTHQTEQYLKYYGDYMLDSGAFTMLMGNAKKINLKTYVDAYIAYINKHDVQKFFELDIDPIIGYDEVKK